MRSLNPLNVLDQREVVYPPEHFTYINYDMPVEKAIKSVNAIADDIGNWIFNNLDGRYYVFNTGMQDSFNNGEFCYRFRIGFELPEESTFFSLAFVL